MKAHEKKRKSRKGNLEIKLESCNEGNLEKWKFMKKKSRKGNLEIKLESGNEGNLEKLKLMKKKGNREKEIWK